MLSKGLLSILFFTSICVLGQNGNECAYPVSIEKNTVYDVTFSVYGASQQVIYKINDVPQNGFSTPEELIQSYFSATDSLWYSKHFLDQGENSQRSEDDFKFYANMDPKTNFVRLLDKYCFTLNGQEYCYVYYLMEFAGTSFKYPTLLSCIKNQGKWLISYPYNQFKLRETIEKFKPETLAQLIEGKPTDNIQLNDLITQSRNPAGYLEVEQLYDISQSWDMNSTDSLKFRLFTNLKINQNSVEQTVSNKVSYISTLDTPLYWDAVDCDKEQVDSVAKVNSSLKLSPSTNIEPVSFLSWKTGEERIYIFKFKDGELKTAVFNENSATDKGLIKDASNALNLLKHEVFKDLMLGVMKSKYASYNQLFEASRGTFGSPNISRLSKELQTTKGKYLEFLEK